MTYRVPCPCGESIEVLASAAGGGVPCPACGRGVPVPRLSQLREMANVGAYESSAIDAIGRLIAEGRLPAGKVCMISGRPTGDWFEVQVECESIYVESGMPPYMLVLVGVLAVLAGWIIIGSPRTTGAYAGRETRTVIPLRIDRAYHVKLARPRSVRKLRKLLKSVPEAERLFAEFPYAKVISGRGVIDPKAKLADVDLLLE